MRYFAFHDYDEFIQLTNDEHDETWGQGGEIYTSSQLRGFRDYAPEVRDGVDGKRRQCLGELAARAIAKHLNLPWVNSMDTFHGPDLAHNIEARLIGADSYGLRVYEKDFKLNKRVVGCVIERGNERGTYRIPGWIHARDAQNEEVLDPYDKGHPFFCVPQNHLQPLNKLRDIIFSERYTMDKSVPQQAMLNL